MLEQAVQRSFQYFFKACNCSIGFGCNSFGNVNVKPKAPGEPGAFALPKILKKLLQLLLGESQCAAVFAFHLGFAFETKFFGEHGGAVFKLCAHFLFLLFAHVAELLECFPHSAGFVAQVSLLFVAPDFDLAAENIGFVFSHCFDQFDWGCDFQSFEVAYFFLTLDVFKLLDRFFTMLADYAVGCHPLRCEKTSGFFLNLVGGPLGLDQLFCCCCHFDVQSSVCDLMR